MTIRNQAAYTANLWDWGHCLDGVFGDNSKVGVSDLDGILEKNGRCLIIEAKSPGAPVKVGQKILFNSLVQSGHTVLIVWGERNKPVKMHLMTPHTDRTYEPATLADFRRIVSSWYAWASKQARPKHRSIRRQL